MSDDNRIKGYGPKSTTYEHYDRDSFLDTSTAYGDLRNGGFRLGAASTGLAKREGPVTHDNLNVMEAWRELQGFHYVNDEGDV